MLRYALEEQEAVTGMNQIVPKSINNPPNTTLEKLLLERVRFLNKKLTGTAKVENNGEDSFMSITNEKKLWIFLNKVKDSVTETVLNTKQTPMRMKSQ